MAAVAPSTTQPIPSTVSTRLCLNPPRSLTLLRQLPQQQPPSTIMLRPFSLMPHRPPPSLAITHQRPTCPMHRPSLVTRPSFRTEHPSSIMPHQPLSTTINQITTADSAGFYFARLCNSLSLSRTISGLSMYIMPIYSMIRTKMTETDLINNTK